MRAAEPVSTGWVDNRVEVISDSVERERNWCRALGEVFEAIGFQPERMELGHGEPSGDASICFVDAQHRELTSILHAIPRGGRSVFLIVDEARTQWATEPGILEHVDDVIVYPFRAFEMESKIRLHHLLRAWNDVHHLNHSFQGLLENLADDVGLAERLQKANLPVRFPSVKGFRVRSRYLAGTRSGGDHFDLGDSKDGSRISVVLSDSSSYGLGSAFLNSLMRVALKLSRDEVRSATQTVKLIEDDLSKVLNEKDRLSLIYGVLNRRDLKFRYLHLGSSVLFHAPAGQSFQPLQSQRPSLSQTDRLDEATTELEISLNANDRLVLLSDGYVERAGGVAEALQILNSLRERESEDTLNEFTFQVKRKFIDEDDMPEQDCSAIVIDVDSKALRLA